MANFKWIVKDNMFTQVPKERSLRYKMFLDDLSNLLTNFFEQEMGMKEEYETLSSINSLFATIYLALKAGLDKLSEDENEGSEQYAK